MLRSRVARGDDRKAFTDELLEFGGGYVQYGSDDAVKGEIMGLAQVALDKTITAAWTMYSMLLGSEGVKLPLDLTFELRREIVTDAIVQVSPARKRDWIADVSGLGKELAEVVCRGKPIGHLVLTPELLKDRKLAAEATEKPSGRAAAPAHVDLADAVFWSIGERVLAAAALPPIVHVQRSGVISLGTGPEIPILEQGTIDVQRICDRLRKWRLLAANGHYTTTGPLPFELTDLLLVLPAEDFPSDVARELFDLAVFRLLWLGGIRWAHWARPEYLKRIRLLAVLAFRAWNLPKETLTNSGLVDVEDQLAIAGETVAQLLHSYGEALSGLPRDGVPRRPEWSRFVESVDASNIWIPGVSENLPETPSHALFPSCRAVTILDGLLRTRATGGEASEKAPIDAPSDPDYETYVAQTHIQTCVLAREEHFLLDDVARTIGVAATTIERWARERRIKQPERYYDQKKKKYHSCFPKSDVLNLWLRGMRNQEFADLLGLSVAELKSTLEAFRKLYPGFDVMEVRQVLLASRGEIPLLDRGDHIHTITRGYRAPGARGKGRVSEPEEEA